MTHNLPRPVRPVPWYLHAGGVLAVAATFVLLVIGQMVTSFRAGMADPIWPTEPWHLLNHYEPSRGYLIEHSHRIAGFTLGGIVTLLVLGLWLTEPCRRSKWAAVVGLAVMIAGYGEFHRVLMAQRDPSTTVKIPIAPVVEVLAGMALVYIVAFWKVAVGAANAGLRLLGTTALVAVMIQGLLGGFRVKLNELVGTDLAAVHGIFAQVVLSLLVLLAVLTERPARPSIGDGRVRSLGGWAIFFTALIFLQIVWGAIIRHAPTPLTQRLHLLTAFLALAVGVLLLRAVFATPSARSRIGLAGWALVILLAAQFYLGVEAWMLKFSASMPPQLVPVTVENAAFRTAHALVGSGILATALVLSVRLRRTNRPETHTPNRTDREWMEPAVAPNMAVEMAGEKVA